ncbi:hypothetical protein [Streptomyces sp. NBC_01803]|nr:hypothetical protein [Streptomyces sp. NBC_01803]WSA47290.1 hypothetical protein OIE51_25795 [Streptomyces sp. NBC_01803]
MGGLETEKPERARWTGPDRWLVTLATLGLVVAIVTCVGQFAR